MNYLLDTNVIVSHLRGKEPINPSWLERGSGISIITYAELFYGVYKSEKPRQNLVKVKQMLADLGIEVIGLNEKMLGYYGRTKAKMEIKGEKLDEFDLLIAATALGLGCVLVTKDKKHFSRIHQLELSS